MQKRKNIYFSLLCTVLIYFSLCVHSLSAESDRAGFFQQANRFYQENKYDQAIAEYNKIIEGGFESGNLYYNMANCYFKKGQLAKAVLNYERAQLFIPSDSDLKTNYRYTQSLLNVGNQAPYKNSFLYWLDITLGHFSLNSLAVILSALQALFFLMLVVMLLYPGSFGRGKPIVLAGLIALFIFSGIAFTLKLNERNKAAIVMSAEIKARFEPLREATAYFTLTQGNKVAIIEKSPNWYKIRRFDGKSGWVEADAVELIF